MAHVFKWKAIYRILKNQRSPQIEETGKKYREEFAALSGSFVLCIQYLNRAVARKTLQIMGTAWMISMFGAFGKQIVDFLGKRGEFFKPEMLDSIAAVATEEAGKIRGGAEAVGAELTGAAEVVGTLGG